MPANIPPGEKVPEFSPIFPDLRIEQIAKLEVHLQYKDDEGDKVWAEVTGLPVYASWEDIKQKAGGGFFKVSARDKKKTFIGTDQKRIHAAPKFLNEIRDAEETEDDDDEDIDDAKSDVRAIIKQQSIILPAAFTAVTTAFVQTSDRHAERMAGMVQTQSAMVTSHGAALDAMARSHRAEIDGYRNELIRMQALLLEREKRIDTLTGDNAGYLKTIATGASGNQWVDIIKQVAPELPKIRALFKPTDGAPSVPQLPASTPPDAARLRFGG